MSLQSINLESPGGHYGHSISPLRIRRSVKATILAPWTSSIGLGPMEKASVVANKLRDTLPSNPYQWGSSVKNSDTMKVHRVAIGPSSLLPSHQCTTCCSWKFGRQSYQTVTWKSALSFCGTCFTTSTEAASEVAEENNGSSSDSSSSSSS